MPELTLAELAEKHTRGAAPNPKIRRAFFYVPCNPAATIDTDVLNAKGLPAGRVFAVPHEEADETGATRAEVRSGRLAERVTYEVVRAAFGQAELKRRLEA